MDAAVIDKLAEKLNIAITQWKPTIDTVIEQYQISCLLHSIVFFGLAIVAGIAACLGICGIRKLIEAEYEDPVATVMVFSIAFMVSSLVLIITSVNYLIGYFAPLPRILGL